MSSSGKELEEQLAESGKKLLHPPSSVDELLSLLEQVESFLSRVEQSPAKSMLTALSPLMKALVADELIRHSDADVKAVVASCISEITRITAPDAPYDDDKMKDVFQLIVSSFENLSDESSRSYNRRAMILETIAKVRSCVVMLDLECDGLIIEMFQHFLKSIRDYHSENVFSSLVTIMTLVLDESEDISLELLRPILASLKIDSEEAQPISRKLGEKVVENCAVKLKPYLSQAVKSLGIALNDYSEVVASILKAGSDGVEHNDDNVHGDHLADESKMAMTSSEQEPQLHPEESKLIAASADDTLLSREIATEEGCPEGVEPSFDKSPKVMSNGDTTTFDDGNLMDLKSFKKTEKNEITTELTVTNDAAKASELLNKTENDDLTMKSTVTNDAEKAQEFLKKENDDLTMESTVKNEEAKTTELLKKSENDDLTMKSTVTNEAPRASEPLENTGNNDLTMDDLTMESTVINKEVKAANDGSDAKKSVMSVSELQQSGKKSGRKPKSSTNLKELSVSTHVESQKEVEKQLDCQDTCSKDAASSPIEHPLTEASVPAESEKESQGVNVSSPCPTDRGLPDESWSKKAGCPKKENKVHEDSPHADGSEKPSEGTIESDVKTEKQLEVTPGRANCDKKIRDVGDISNNEDVRASDSEAKQPKQSRENVDSNSKGENQSLLKKEDGKRLGRGKPSLKKDMTKSTKDEAKAFADGSEKPSEGTIESDVKTEKQLEVTPGRATCDKKIPDVVDISNNEDVTASDSEAKQPNQSRENVDSNCKGENRSLLKKEDGKRLGRGKPSLKKDMTKSTKDEAKAFANGSEKPSEGTIESDVKTEKQLDVGDISNNEDVTASDSEAKQPKQSRENVDSNSKGENRSLLKKEDGKRLGRGKPSLKKDMTKSTKDEAKAFVSSPKSSTKSVKNEGRSEEVSKISSKRKHTPDQDQETEKITYNEKLVGLKVKVWWPDDHRFYEGEITHFEPVKKKHTVSYADGDIEILNLKEEKWDFIKDYSSDWEEEIQQQSLDASPEMPRKKKAKTDSESSSKRGKMKTLPTRRGSASSSKSKGSASKSGHRSSNEVKVNGKSKDRTSESHDESEYATPGKKFQSQKGHGKSKDVDSGVPRATKSKHEILQASTKSKQDSPKTTAKPKQDTRQAATKSKGKSPPSGSKSNANFTDKVKISSSRVIEEVEVKEKSQGSAKNLETSKRKSTDSLKTDESEAKSGKKRHRGGKN